MRHFLFLLAFVFLCACSVTTPPTTALNTTTTPRSTLIPPTPTADPALRAEITPDSNQSFKQVAARAPFSVTFAAKISGGASPYQVEWDFDGDGKTDSAEEKPAPFTFTQAGEYTATVTVKDRAGKSASSTRRIVAIGGALVPTWKYGVTAHFERRRAGYYPTLAEVTRAAELAQAAGIQAVRIDFNWDMLNPEEHRWEFRDYDAMVQIVRAHKLDILAIVDYSSWWASSAQDSNDWRVRLYSEPRRNYDFAQYTYELVSHFKSEVRVWQIWNEPNTIGFWKPQPNAAHYAQLLQEAYLAAKYADPKAVVVFAGMSGNGIDGDAASGLATNFIAEAYAAGAKNYFDVMAIHPYMLPNSGINAVREKIAATRAVLNKNGDEKIPLWLTEIGVPNDAPWWQTAPLQSETDAANWLAQVYTHLFDVTPTIFWYDLQDQSIGAEPEQHFGLLHLDFSPKPGYEKLKSLVASR